MLFLSNQEKTLWAELSRDIMTRHLAPADFRGGDGHCGDVRANLLPIFRFYIGALLAATGQDKLGKAWITSGTLIEEDGLFFNAYLTGFLQRHHDRLEIPEQVFADPRPYVHFTTVPIMQKSRACFLTQCGHTLPKIKRPFRLMDIGCGDGGLTAALLKHLQATGKIEEIGEILLVDPSPAMLALAKETVGKTIPSACIKTLNHRIEQVAGKLNAHYDMALCSLSYHHMPYEQKVIHLKELKPWIDHLVLFELDANNDFPELQTPELAASVYQSYGRLIDFVFSHDAPIEVAQACVDRFLMTEAVSLLTQRRGARNDYHMLRTQWYALFEQTLAPEFLCLCDSPCYADEYFSLFTIHYGRG
ncbi:MAG: methyltransferase [Verrucomicrobia bacterium]|nr:methyltransferase [Verrucomicrobiota bacterium]MBU1733876.1 methyltransferase [Verrucomicrobiota bacterium]MBU1856298.1 methyltransferase [Verrucomicrobiota bacterium]